MSVISFTLGRLIRPQRARDLIVLLALLCTAIVPALLLYRAPRAATITMDTPPALLPREGFYRPEQLAGEEGVYSWTNGSSTLNLPNPGGDARLRIELLGPTQSPTPVQMRVGTLPLNFLVRPELRVYSIALPATWRERITLTIDSPQVEIHRRRLGIGMSNIEVAGGGAAPTQVLIALAFAALSGYMLLRQARLSTLAAAGVVLAFQVLTLVWLAADGWSYARLSTFLPLLGGAGLAAVALERFFPAVRAAATPPIAWAHADKFILITLLVAALGLRLLYLTAPDPVGDLALSARRMGFLHASGLAGAYTNEGDYLPLRLYWLLGLSKLVLLLGGSFVAPLPPTTLVLIKLPGLLADLATIVVIYHWSRHWRSARGAAIITALYTLAPPVWIDVAWWGQIDAVLMLPLLGAVILLDRAEGCWSWLCWASALLIKTQAIVLAPLLFISTLRQYGCRGLVRGAALASGLLVLAYAPLVLAGQLPGLLQSYIGSVGRFPRTTVAAYNLWYLALNGDSARDTEYVVGTVSYNIAGFTLFGLVALIVCVALLRRSDAAARAESAAVLALAFFALPTQIHERYLYLALAFLILRIASAPRLIPPYLILVLTATLNILGTLKGFTPEVYTFMASSRLSLLLAALNLLVLGMLIAHLLLVTRRTAGRGDAQPTRNVVDRELEPVHPLQRSV